MPWTGLVTGSAMQKQTSPSAMVLRVIINTFNLQFAWIGYITRIEAYVFFDRPIVNVTLDGQFILIVMNTYNLVINSQRTINLGTSYFF